MLKTNKQTLNSTIILLTNVCLVPFGEETEVQRDKWLTQYHTASEWCSLERVQQQSADPVGMFVLF